MIGNVLGMVLIAQGCLMFLPVLVDLIYQEGLYDSYLIVIAICLVLGYVLTRKRARMNSYFAKDGMIAVGLAWIVLSFFGGLPFYLSGEIPSFVDCFFEAVSGFTTTGSSILTEVESLKHATLFWRSFTHWIGGMGILVFILALMPKSNDRDMHIMRAEAPGPTIGKLVPRMRQSAMILYAMYMGLTVIMVILLLIGKMPLFDALCNTFGTAGTGGFAIKNASKALGDNARHPRSLNSNRSMLARRATTKVLLSHNDVTGLNGGGKRGINILHSMRREMSMIRRVEIPSRNDHISINVTTILKNLAFKVHTVLRSKMGCGGDLIFTCLFGQSCSHGEHIKCSPARAELAINLMPFGQSRAPRVQRATHRTGLSE